MDFKGGGMPLLMLCSLSYFAKHNGTPYSDTLWTATKVSDYGKGCLTGGLTLYSPIYIHIYYVCNYCLPEYGRIRENVEVLRCQITEVPLCSSHLHSPPV